MKCVVIGAGAWGLPAAAELTRRGHAVTLIDRHGPLNTLASSGGSTRLWRLADPDPLRVRLAQRGVDAMHRLAERAGTPVFLTRGLLWRDDQSLPAVQSTLDALGVTYTSVAPGDVDRFFPGLRGDGRDALWQPVAGVVLAVESLKAQLKLFRSASGATVLERDVAAVEQAANGVRVVLDGGGAIDADVAVIAAGPGAGPLLSPLGLELGTTFVYVTHDQDEALVLSDRIAVFNKARIEQIGSPTDLYERPKSIFVARFLGESSLFYGKLEDGLAINAYGRRIVAGRGDAASGDAVAVVVRPERIRILTGDAEPEAVNAVPGTVIQEIYLGNSRKVEVSLPDGTVALVRESADSITPTQTGQKVWLTFDPDVATILPADT
ncbi:FAD-dependent oxidoreductase [Mycolicibacterium fortuitum]|uniref:FAD-dependent oxidoreductase n=1 Tax=Mycolicibacterium fortuitum TaxID=1766 RepID=UPI001F48D990|nr:FAD-dependent oxidoreductase [Mycolicibacterium fortuitum]